MNVIGYSNPNNYYPSPLITFVKDGENHYVIYPSCTMIEIENFSEIKDIIPHYIPENNELEINHGSYAFALSRESILIGSPVNVREKLEIIAKENSDTIINISLLHTFLKNTTSDKRVITWLDYIESIKDNIKIRVLITSRNIIHKGECVQAERLIIQLRKLNGYKSHLRKNFHYNKTFSDVPLLCADILPIHYRLSPCA
jgi:hypothetical protein